MQNNDPEIGDEDPLAPSEPPNSSRPEQHANFLKSKINEVQFPLVMVCGSSLILLLSVIMWEGEIRSRGYALSVPAISIVLSAYGVGLTVFREDLYGQYGQHLAHALFAWNFAGACFLTFSSPFTTTGNGYFAAWACFASSAMTMGLTSDVIMERVQGLGPVMGLCASSFVVIFALIDYIGYDVDDYVRSESIYAMVVSVLTLILCGGLLYFKRQAGKESLTKKENLIQLAIISVVSVAWVVLACWVTFSGPFYNTGNGYFASWCGCVCACAAAFNAKNEVGVLPNLMGLSNDIPTTGLSATIT